MSENNDEWQYPDGSNNTFEFNIPSFSGNLDGELEWYIQSGIEISLYDISTVETDFFLKASLLGEGTLFPEPSCNISSQLAAGGAVELDFIIAEAEVEGQIPLINLELYECEESVSTEDFTIYKSSTSNIHEDNVYSIAFLSNAEIWLGTETGLSKWSGGNDFMEYTSATSMVTGGDNSLLDLSIINLEFSPSGELWFSGGNRITKWVSGNEFLSQEVPLSIISTKFSSDESLFIYGDKIYILDINDFSYEELNSDYGGNGLGEIVFSPSNVMFISDGGNSLIGKLVNDEVIDQLAFQDVCPIPPVTECVGAFSRIVLTEDKIWVGGNSGLAYWETANGNFKIFNGDDFGFTEPVFTSITALYSDGANSVWAAISTNNATTLVKIDGESVTQKFDQTNSNLPNENINVITITDNGKLMLGTSGAGIVVQN